MVTHARPVVVGGVGKAELLARLQECGVELNAAARALFDDDRFVPAARPSRMGTVELSVADLGLAEGGVMSSILEGAARRGLAPCPLELGPHLRLEMLDQPEGHRGQPATRHRAPPGSLTIVSPPLDDGDQTPKGFYLRRIEGVLWLRGYRSGADHVWSPEDRLVFCILAA